MKPITFKSAAEFREWLRKNHNQCDALWLQIFKKDSGETSITYAEALDQALCFGWIDGQKKPYDERSWLQNLLRELGEVDGQKTTRSTSKGLWMPA